jgi:hypothetical protein
MYALYEVGIVMAQILAKSKLEERAREEREREAGAA